MSSDLYLILVDAGIEKWEEETGRNFLDLPDKEREKLEQRFYEDGTADLIDEAYERHRDGQ